MQNITSLSEKDAELIAAACRHAKERFKPDLISIAGAVRTRQGNIYTGINLKYRVGNVSTCG